MTAYTSTQTGEFNVASTWGGGGYPSANGDTFNIAAGHTVTCNANAAPSDGFGDSYIYGVLVHVDSKIHMNGRLYIKGGGTLHSKAGSQLLFKGATNDTHGLFHENETYANWIAEGSDGTPCTKISGNQNAEVTVLPVDSATNFAVGDWISVYDNISAGHRSDHNWHTYYCDEGFWIHDINGNNIYFKRFVGPEDVTISEASGTTLTLSNAKKFSVGHKVIFGTGNNRNVTSISAVDYSKNQVTIADSLVGTISAGTGIFYTGTEKFHVDNSKVRKIATVTTAASNGGTNTVTLASKAGFAVDDEIWIEARSECGASGGTADTDDINESTYNAVHTIQSIDNSTNVITLTSNLPYNVVSGALVTRLTRDIVVGAQTLGTDKPYYYMEHTGSYSRKLILKDVYFRGVGNSNNNVYSGVTFRGYASTNDGADGDGGDKDGDDWNANTNALPVTVSVEYQKHDQSPWIEGISAWFNSDGHARDHSGLWLWDARGFRIRCGTVIRSRDGLHGYWDPDQAYYNCIVAESRYRGIRAEGHHDRTEYAYCYLSRCERGIHINDWYDPGLGIHDIISDASDQYGLYLYNAGPLSGGMWNIRITGCRYGVLLERNGTDIHLIRSSIKQATAYEQSDPTGQMFWAGSSRSGHYGLYGYNISRAVFLNEDFEYDKVGYYSYHIRYEWDETEQAYSCRRRSDSSGYPVISDCVYVPPNTVLKIRTTMKAKSGFSGTRPYTFASTYRRGWGLDQNNTTEWQTMTGGGHTMVQFTSTFDSGWESKDTTVAAVPFGRYVEIGIFSNSSNATEGFYLKPIKAVLDSTSPNPEMGKHNNMNTTAGLIRMASSLDDGVIRLGGGIT